MTYGGSLFAAYWAQHLEQLPPDDEVWYWADSQVTLYSQTGVVSHTFSGGKGVVKFNAPVTTMGQALRGTAITDVIFPACIEQIGGYAFYNCASLALSSLPSVSYIGDVAFYWTAIAIDRIPASVRNLGNGSFWLCLGITSVSFGGTPESIISGNTFRACTNLLDIYVPWASTDAINAYAPWGATNATIHYNYTT